MFAALRAEQQAVPSGEWNNRIVGSLVAKWVTLPPRLVGIVMDSEKAGNSAEIY